jgi:NAD(P)H-hydrate repair Nnr-like enzyme with NAD(P)H-hydrate dehydratase domain
MEEKAPDYNGHVVLALKGMAAAVRSGADMVCVSANFDAAVQASPDSMLNLWLRSKYLYRNFKDKVSERTDLKAIRDLKVEYSPGFTPLNRMIRLMAEKKYKH